MNIRFVMTIDDLRDVERNKIVGSYAWTWLVLVPIVLGFFLPQFVFQAVIFGFVLNLDVTTNILVMAIILAMMVGYAASIARIKAWILEWWTRKAVARVSESVSFGWHEMEVQDGCLIITKEDETIELELLSIKKLDIRRESAVVHAALSPTFVIPLNHFPEAEARRFVDELRDAWENRHSGPPTELRAPHMSPADERIEELR